MPGIMDPIGGHNLINIHLAIARYWLFGVVKPLDHKTQHYNNCYAIATGSLL